MKFFNSQCFLDFEQAIWETDPELLVMDQILDENPHIIKIAASCFPNAHPESQARVGRGGMTLEQVVRAAIYYRYKKLTFIELSDKTIDSKKGRTFMKMKPNQYFSPQALQENIAKISTETLEKIHEAVVSYGIEIGVDNGQKMRTDSTAIASNIRKPSNASLLWDCIRVGYRLLDRTQKLLKIENYRCYQKSAKKLFFKIVNTHKKEKRHPLFVRLIQSQERCQRQAFDALKRLSKITFNDAQREKNRQKYVEALTDLLPKMQIVHDMAYRREILGEEVAVSDKIFSIFEDHTNCVVKGQRDIIFGHKINFASGKSNLIFDCIQELGNPSDSSYFSKTIDNLNIKYNITPRDFAGDGGYASKANLDYATAKGIVNIVFNKVKGSMKNIASSPKMETMLKKWRAGMEAIISNFKRGLDASRCPWKGWEHFKCFVLWNLITFNLRVISRYILEKL